MTLRLPAMVLLLAAAIGGPDRPRSAAAHQADRGDLVPVELAAVGVDPGAATPIVLLRDPASGDVVPIWVGEAEARAIALALHGVDVPRPMTHDLMASLLSTLGATVVEVVVHDLVNSTYLGTVRLRIPGEDTPRDVDSRPSDALALALRTDAPIRVARTILASSPEFDFVAPDGPQPIVQLRGITVVAPTPEQRREFQTGDGPGALVTHATARARQSGVRPGDLIVDADGRQIREPMEFFAAVRAAGIAPVRLVVKRRGETREIELPSAVPSAPGEPDPPGERFTV